MCWQWVLTCLPCVQGVCSCHAVDETHATAHMKVQEPSVRTGVRTLLEASLDCRIWVRKFSASSRLRASTGQRLML